MGTAFAQEPYVESSALQRPAGFLLIAIVGAVAAGCSMALALTNDAINSDVGEPLVIALLSVWVTMSYILCGLLAWWHRPASRFGPLMIAAGFANFLASLSWATNDLVFTFGQSLDLLPPVLFLHVFLAFPSGHLHGRFEQGLVVAAYVTAISLELVRMAFGDFGPHNLLEISPNADAALAATRVQLTLVSAYCLAGVGILIARRLRTGRALRRSLTLLADAFGLALIMIATLFISAAWGGPAVPQIRWATFAALSMAPVAFLVAFLDSRLARSSVGKLFVDLEADPAPTDLRDALARALGDPSLTLAYWLPDYECYADIDGRLIELPGPESGRTTTLIEQRSSQVAALLHDPALNDEPELLAAVTAAAGIAIENGRLHAQLRAHLVELRASRARIIDVGQKERQRLERNLHDGAQQRLIALSLELSALERRLADDPEARASLDQARREIAISLEELRDVARGLHPAVVSGHGLEIALEQLAARAPVPVRLVVQLDGRLPEPLEVAAYYLVSESLANVGKHAHARSATVAVSRVDGEVIVEIVDDGGGGADTELGSGLRGLADRVEALGGRLRVWSPEGGGTRVRAEIPCVL
ncbi:MAG: histidine kinase [Gaiellaceae bacterium]